MIDFVVQPFSLSLQPVQLRNLFADFHDQGGVHYTDAVLKRRNQGIRNVFRGIG
jgi:hypothetical protein